MMGRIALRQATASREIYFDREDGPKRLAVSSARQLLAVGMSFYSFHKVKIARLDGLVMQEIAECCGQAIGSTQGLCFSDDGRRLFFSDSSHNRVCCVTVSCCPNGEGSTDRGTEAEYRHSSIAGASQLVFSKGLVFLVDFDNIIYWLDERRPQDASVETKGCLCCDFVMDALDGMVLCGDATPGADYGLCRGSQLLRIPASPAGGNVKAQLLFSANSADYHCVSALSDGRVIAWDSESEQVHVF